jgi:hypothetical protein
MERINQMTNKYYKLLFIDNESDNEIGKTLLSKSDKTAKIEGENLANKLGIEIWSIIKYRTEVIFTEEDQPND